jgi:hypothetical protein
MPPGRICAVGWKDGRGAFCVQKSPGSHATGTGTAFPPKSAAEIGVRNIFGEMSKSGIPERLPIEPDNQNKQKQTKIR